MPADDLVRRGVTTILKFTKVKRNLKTGTATILAKVSGPGKLMLSGNKVVKVKRTSSGAAVVKLSVRAKGKAKTTLTKAGKVKVMLKVIFAPSGGGSAVSQTTSLVLKKRMP